MPPLGLSLKLPYVNQNEKEFTCVLLETGQSIAPAPATLALALAIDGKREPKAVAERNTTFKTLVCST